MIRTLLSNNYFSNFVQKWYETSSLDTVWVALYCIVLEILEFDNFLEFNRCPETVFFMSVYEVIRSAYTFIQLSDVSNSLFPKVLMTQLSLSVFFHVQK